MPEKNDFSKFSQCLNYLTETEKQQIQKAYELATYAHRGALRDGGSPYITHPIAVARILANLKMDSETIIAGLLHDVVEDTDISLYKIQSNFSETVANLVNGVTKLKKIKIKSSSNFLPQIFNKKNEERFSFERHVESLRKMLLATADDIRVIIIKLADRLHNMQTLDKARPDKRGRIAQETLELYSPIAYRLGMGDFKGQLEDLAFPYVYPQEFKAVKNLIGDKLETKEEYIKKFIHVIKQNLGREKIKIIDIHGRAKHLYSLWKKLNQHNNDLNKIYDLVAIRIIVPTIADCYQTLGFIHSKWNPLIGRIKDYISLPKPNGYQSLHTTIFGPSGEIIEIQIRTPEMHEHAENGIAAHWHYKERGKNQKNNPQANKIIEELSHLGSKIKDPQEFKTSLNLDFLKDRIFVFTPEGDVVDLPVGATTIDFAYAIHSDLGHSTQSAKINGKIIPLQTELNNGDIIEIFSSNSSKPRRDWLKFVKTTRARNHIKSRLGLT